MASAAVPLDLSKVEPARPLDVFLPSLNLQPARPLDVAWPSPNVERGRLEPAWCLLAALPSPNAEGTKDGDDQPYDPSEKKADGDDDLGAIVVADHPSNHAVVVMADDHGDHKDTPTDVAIVMSALPTLLEEVQPTSHSSPMEALSSPSSLQKYTKDSANRSRRKRGPTRALDVHLLPKGQKIKVKNNERGQAIGGNANELTSFMGTIARKGFLAPLTYKDWRMMPQTYKDKMWNCILEKFDIDKCMMRWVMKSLSTKWKKWKYNLKKKHYDTHETDEERLADCDERVFSDQWIELVRFWSSEEGTKLCERNKANRAKSTFIHTMGTKSCARLSEEEKSRTSDGSEPIRVEFFIKTHQKSGERKIKTNGSILEKHLEETLQENQQLR